MHMVSMHQSNWILKAAIKQQETDLFLWWTMLGHASSLWIFVIHNVDAAHQWYYKSFFSLFKHHSGMIHIVAGIGS